MAPKPARNVAKRGGFVSGQGPRTTALGAVVLTVALLVLGAPFGVTDGGLKLHVAPAGRPLHEKVTAELNPFRGVTVKVAVALQQRSRAWQDSPKVDSRD